MSEALATPQDTEGIPRRSSERRSVIVKNLPATVDETRLSELFSNSFPLKHSTLIYKKDTTESQGYGFITFVRASDALQAIKSLNGTVVDGNRIKIAVAERRMRGNPRSARPKEAVQSKELQTPGTSKQLIVRNLPWKMHSEKCLRDLFRECGSITRIRIPQKSGSIAPGFAFVTFEHQNDAIKALSVLNGVSVEGRILAIDWAVSKEAWQRVAPTIAHNTKAHGQMVDLLNETRHVTLSKGRRGTLRSSRSVSGQASVETKGLGIVGKDVEPDAANRKYPHKSTDLSKFDRQAKEIFVQNLPIAISNNDLKKHFESFGPVQYARMVSDSLTGRSRGTAFICFKSRSDRDRCLQHVPRASNNNDTHGPSMSDSRGDIRMISDLTLQEINAYYLGGRLLSISKVIGKDQLARKAEIQKTSTFEDRRHLDLFHESDIGPQHAAYASMSSTERKLRQENRARTFNQIQQNTSLHISLSRLSIRNLPIGTDSKSLKHLARQAVVKFAEEVKQGLRAKLSSQEVFREKDVMQQAERKRKLKGIGIVKQAKILHSSYDARPVAQTRKERPKPYGFVAFSSHRWALMALRWLNGRDVIELDTNVPAHSTSLTNTAARGRVIAEFAIENLQVTQGRAKR